MKHLYQSAAVFTLLFLAVIPGSLRAATITVTNAADDGAGTLRAALENAAGGDTIDFSLPAPPTIILSTELLINRSVTIIGPVAVGSASGGILNRVFRINANTTVTLSSLAITGAGSGVVGSGIYNENANLTVSNCVISGSAGGGIYNYASSGSANVTLLNSTVSGNFSQFGGGVVNLSQDGTATLIIHGSTISGNSAQFGGGIWNAAQGGSASATILNSTVSGNSATYAGGILNEAEGAGSSADLQIANCTFSGNSASALGGGVWNSSDTGGSAMAKIGSTILNSGESGGNLANEPGAIFTSDGYNLSSDDGGGVLTDATDQTNTDPALGPLQNNGGPTFTQALSACSPAIDHGRNFSGLAFDQRNAGFARIFDDPGVQNPAGGDGTDIGAVEAQLHLLDTTPPSLTCPSNFTVEFTDDSGAVVNYSVMVTDTCDAAPEVVIVPSSGSLFPIGVTIVQCTAQDANGNAASGSFGVTVLGAKGTHENVLADLMNFRATVSERGDGKKLDATIAGLGKSSNSGGWSDQTHLQPKSGKKVFQQDKESVRRLHDLITSKRSNLPDVELQGFINRIIRADRLLASVAIQDAITAGVSTRKVGQIQKYLVKGDVETGAADYGKGIQDYGNAWKLAIQMKIAPSTRLEH